MKKIIFLLCICSILFAQEEKNGFFQKYPFVNQTEIGLNFGKINDTYYNYPCYYCSYVVASDRYSNSTSFVVKNLEFQTFNGIRLNDKTDVGLVAAANFYANGKMLVPLGLGLRRQLLQKKSGGSKLEAGLEGGKTLLNFLDKNYISYKSGFWGSLFVGFKFPMKNTSSILFRMGYRYQHFKSEATAEFDPYYLSKTDYNFNRYFARLGFEF